MGAPVTQHTTPAASVAIRNILFATDFSAASDAALDVALALAKRYSAALFVTHILPPEPRYELPLEPQPDAMNVRKRDAQANFDALVASGVLSDVVHEPILRCGELKDTLRDVIASRDIDLVVTGTHGREGVGKLLLGSVAEKIFRSAACPVLTVGPHALRELCQTGFRSVLYATDFTPASLNALPYAYSLAQRERAQLTMVHVVQPLPAVPDALVMPAAENDEAEFARQRMQDLLRAYPPLAVRPELVTMTGAPAEAIVYVASQRKYVLHKADLIVLGVRRKGSAATHFPWSVADAIVCRAACPVLTVRGE